MDLADSELCARGDVHTMSHVDMVDWCPLTGMVGGLICLHVAVDNTRDWLTSWLTSFAHARSIRPPQHNYTGRFQVQ